MNEREIRLALFCAIECGSNFWGREISQYGVHEIHQRLAARSYDPIKSAAIFEKFSQHSATETFTAIAAANGQFLIPGDLNWPTKLDDLAVPPIGIIVRGNAEVLNEPSLAIVGTRNPSLMEFVSQETLLPDLSIAAGIS